MFLRRADGLRNQAQVVLGRRGGNQRIDDSVSIRIIRFHVLDDLGKLVRRYGVYKPKFVHVPAIDPHLCIAALFMGIGDAELLCVLLRVGALGHRQRQACAVFKRRVFDAQHAVRQGYRAQRAVSGEGIGADSRQPLFDDDGRQSRAVAKGAVAKALHGFGNAKRDHIRAARKRFAFDVQHAVGDGDVSARVPPVQCLRANRAAQQHKAQQSRPKSLHGISLQPHSSISTGYYTTRFCACHFLSVR